MSKELDTSRQDSIIVPHMPYAPRHRKSSECLEVYDANGDTSLIAALKKRDFQAASGLIAMGVNVNAPNITKGRTALFYAVMYNRADLVHILLQRKAIVDFKDNNGQTPLFEAAIEGNLNITMDLLHAGADACAEDNSGITPLIYSYAFNKPNVAVVKFLVANGATFRRDALGRDEYIPQFMRDDYDGPLPYKERQALLRLLIDNGVAVPAISGLHPDLQKEMAGYVDECLRQKEKEAAAARKKRLTPHRPEPTKNTESFQRYISTPSRLRNLIEQSRQGQESDEEEGAFFLSALRTGSERSL